MIHCVTNVTDLHGLLYQLNDYGDSVSKNYNTTSNFIFNKILKRLCRQRMLARCSTEIHMCPTLSGFYREGLGKILYNCN